MASTMHNYVSFIFQTMTHKQLNHVIQLLSNIMQKKFSWTLSVQIKSVSNCLNNPKLVVDCPWTVPSSSLRSHFFRIGMRGHFRPHNFQNHFHGLLDKEYPSRRKPLPPGVCQNFTILVPMCSPYSGDQLCLLSRRTDRREI